MSLDLSTRIVRYRFDPSFLRSHRQLFCVLFSVTLIIFAAANVTAGPGDLDTAFSGDGKLIDREGFASGVATQPDGRIVVSIGPGFAVARYNEDGSPDMTFGVDGQTSASFGSETATALDVAIQSDGKIVAAGYVCPCDDWGNSGFAVARFNADGSPDLSFDGDGQLTTAIGGRTTGYSVILQPDGKIIVAGWSWEAAPPFVKDHFALARYNPDGSLDTTFDADGKVSTSVCADCHDEAFAVALQSDGKIVAVGGGFDGTSNSKWEVVRYNTDGSLDTSFDSDGRLTTTFGDRQTAFAVAIQRDGKIVAGGVATGAFALARYNQNGSLDTTFNFDGRVTTEIGSGADISSVAIQPDGKIIASGSAFDGFDSPTFDFAVARYDQAGTLDSKYALGGLAGIDFGDRDDAPRAMTLDYAGRVVVVGYSNSNVALARLQADPRPPLFDFDGDGRSDVSVFRPADSVWYLSRSTAGFSATQFGISTDKITPADYDGDRRADIAVYRDGFWYWLRSSDNSFKLAQFGDAADIPVPADYTGDGRAELGLYRGGMWLTYDLTNGQTRTIQFGISSDDPVPADYDGDGRADEAVFRDGVWYLNRSSQGFAALPFGISTDRAVADDYDGDLRADPAVYRDGIWYLLNSSQGFTAFQFGIATDTPVPADYDGDGRADAAVYRNGTWYLNQSTSGFAAQQFGAAADKPVPAGFLP